MVDVKKTSKRSLVVHYIFSAIEAISVTPIFLGMVLNYRLFLIPVYGWQASPQLSLIAVTEGAQDAIKNCNLLCCGGP